MAYLEKLKLYLRVADAEQRLTGQSNPCLVLDFPTTTRVDDRSIWGCGDATVGSGCFMDNARVDSRSRPGTDCRHDTPRRGSGTPASIQRRSVVRGVRCDAIEARRHVRVDHRSRRSNFAQHRVEPVPKRDQDRVRLRGRPVTGGIDHRVDKWPGLERRPAAGQRQRTEIADSCRGIRAGSSATVDDRKRGSWQRGVCDHGDGSSHLYERDRTWRVCSHLGCESHRAVAAMEEIPPIFPNADVRGEHGAARTSRLLGSRSPLVRNRAGERN